VIEGRIIRIFDYQTVALNVGSDHGVERGMTFGIYTPVERIVDPETGAVLGETRRRKALVDAASVHNRFTIATSQTRVVRVGGASTVLGAFQGTTERQQDELPVAAGQLQPYETGTEIRVGDHVEEIVRAPAKPENPAPTTSDPA
jgi:hypothetical protein